MSVVEAKIISAIKKGLGHPILDQFGCFSFTRQLSGLYHLSLKIYSLEHPQGVYSFSADGFDETVKLSSTSTLLGGFYSENIKPSDLKGQLTFSLGIEKLGPELHLVLRLFHRGVQAIDANKLAVFAWPWSTAIQPVEGTIIGDGTFGPVLL